LVSGERALNLVAALDPTYRVPGNASFERAIRTVVESLEEVGFQPEGSGTEERLTYRIEGREMSGPTWDAVGGSLSIVGRDEPLMTLSTNMNLLAAYSFPTPQGGVEAELVDVGDGPREAFEGLDVRGKVVMGDGSPGQLFRRAVLEHGALGVLAYRLPSFNDPQVNRDLAPMSSIPYDPGAGSWGLALSLNARDALRDALRAGATKVRVEIESRLYPSEELTLVAEVRGDGLPEERFVFSAHVQESGANDNLSGVASLTEVARSLGEAVKTGAFSPLRTITMIWGDEISSTRRYLEEDPDRARAVRWGMSLDMVGEDTGKTGGTFLIEKMPDPSAVWTRGEDRHTEWGGRPLTLEDMTPHYLNDFVLQRCLAQASDTGWEVRTNPYEGGSDHVPFLRAGVPGILLWHFTDQFYHTDGDRLEMVSPATLENVSVCAMVSAMALTRADGEMTRFMAAELLQAATQRIQREEVLSKAALAGGEDPAEEQRIIGSWVDWYVAAVRTLEELEPGGPSPETRAALGAVEEAISEAGRQALARLTGRA